MKGFLSGIGIRPASLFSSLVHSGSIDISLFARSLNWFSLGIFRFLLFFFKVICFSLFSHRFSSFLQFLSVSSVSSLFYWFCSLFFLSVFFIYLSDFIVVSSSFLYFVVSFSVFLDYLCFFFPFNFLQRNYLVFLFSFMFFLVFLCSLMYFHGFLMVFRFLRF